MRKRRRGTVAAETVLSHVRRASFCFAFRSPKYRTTSPPAFRATRAKRMETGEQSSLYCLFRGDDALPLSYGLSPGRTRTADPHLSEVTELFTTGHTAISRWGTGDTGMQPPKRESSCGGPKPASRPPFGDRLHGTFGCLAGVEPASAMSKDRISSPPASIRRNARQIGKRISIAALPNRTHRLVCGCNVVAKNHTWLCARCSVRTHMVRPVIGIRLTPRSLRRAPRFGLARNIAREPRDPGLPFPACAGCVLQDGRGRRIR